MKATVVDYGVGNLHSISKGLERAGARAAVSSNPYDVARAECIVFPGVGAFGAAMQVLRPAIDEIRDAITGGVPALGICLGMQVLFERSEESAGEGIGVLKGEARRLDAPRVPHMGWNEVRHNSDALFEGIEQDTQFYFANSYVCVPTEKVTLSETEYGLRFPSAVRKGRTCGVQFHPEKSSEPGLRLLSNFIRLSEGTA
ncbi:MAG: imidazole glycerol phosphate synthase subunit HisH [Methanobacteriota archaeon]|nr:MAG: imidazole glycerol phosphate synthase subunit HisH [Euryarchaeota archaeon]